MRQACGMSVAVWMAYWSRVGALPREGHSSLSVETQGRKAERKSAPHGLCRRSTAQLDACSTAMLACSRGTAREREARGTRGTAREREARRAQRANARPAQRANARHERHSARTRGRHSARTRGTRGTAREREAGTAREREAWAKPKVHACGAGMRARAALEIAGQWLTESR